MLIYLERIECNIPAYITGIEEKVLSVMLEYLYRITAETHITRSLTDLLVLRSDNVAYSKEELLESHTDYDQQRERQVVRIAEKVAAASKLAKPTLSARPAVQEPPKPVPTAKPATAPAASHPSSGTIPTTR